MKDLNLSLNYYPNMGYPNIRHFKCNINPGEDGTLIHPYKTQ